MAALSAIVSAMNKVDAAFFDYHCDRCDAPVCERVQVMNLALNYVEDLFCMPCLALEEGLPLTQILPTAKDYVQARDCFKLPWEQFSAQAAVCPLLKENSCFCQDQNVA